MKRVPTQEESAAEEKITVGIAWRQDADSPFQTNILKVAGLLGWNTVILPEAEVTGWLYDETGVLDSRYVSNEGYLKQEYADILKSGKYADNTAEVLKGVDMVILTGGEDVSPTLLASPQPWHGIEEERDYNATRDVSDYLVLSSCLKNDIVTLATCRGSQMLGVVSGASIIQDIPTFFAGKGVEYGNLHRALKPEEGEWPYAHHDIEIAAGTKLHSLLSGKTSWHVLSWHHQCLCDVSATLPLRVSAVADTQGYDSVEAIERTDKTCVIGIQFYPETTAVNYLERKAGAQSFADYKIALQFFTKLHEQAVLKKRSRS